MRKSIDGLAAKVQRFGANPFSGELFVFSNSFSRRAVRKFRLKDLDPAAEYRIVRLFADDEPERTASGAELMRYGVLTELPENQNIRLSAGLYRISKI